MAGRHPALSAWNCAPHNTEPEEEDIIHGYISSKETSEIITKASSRHSTALTEGAMRAEPMHSWAYTGSDTVSVISESSIRMPTTLYPSVVHSNPCLRDSTALLGGNLRVQSQMEGYGSMEHRHSILRMGASKTSSGSGLRKSVSVEFVLDHALEHAPKYYTSTSLSGREPRRLTFEEKAELYRIRPDLEIDPSSYVHDQVERINRRNQRRVIFAMFGGMISVILLLVFYFICQRSIIYLRVEHFFLLCIMRLITHNLLMCNKKGVENGFPLTIEADEIEVVTCDFQADFVRKMLTKLDWDAFLMGAKALKLADGLPETLPSAETNCTDDETLRTIHHVLLEVHVKQGKLVCPESHRVFPIIDGIPNMLLNEDEV
ncbi:hypothetical protein CCR75_000901 [Bremia lactucae]|uniref:Multifunctional methyltransferase subunit TRM112-like protein n=1 Tax=Bremia lactucae TaxID=4779 RepID=A0A976FLF9_BRELC|nr:hypothetical protein CCR75_000901 [Bremia lactucae]